MWFLKSHPATESIHDPREPLRSICQNQFGRERSAGKGAKYPCWTHDWAVGLRGQTSTLGVCEEVGHEWCMWPWCICICWETIKIIARCLPKLSSCLRNTSAYLQFSCSKFKIFPENIFFPPSLLSLFQNSVGSGEGSRVEPMLQMMNPPLDSILSGWMRSVGQSQVLESS